MRKVVVLLICFILFSGLVAADNTDFVSFDIEELYDYQKVYKSEELNVCSMNRTKTYMDYRMTTVVSSRQYQFIHNYMKVDELTGFLYDQDGFIGVALGSYYGKIGDRFYFTLDNGIVLPLVKVEEKSDRDTDSMGCYHNSDGSVIEFVIDSYRAADYFGNYGNGLVLNGNYANYELFSGQIVKVEAVTDEMNEDYVYFGHKTKDITESIFHYASGY